MIKKIWALGLAAALSAASIPVNAGTVRVPFVMNAGTNAIQSFSFGDVGVGQYVYATFTYKNNGAQVLTITSKTTEGAADLVDNDCGDKLLPQASCNVVVGLNVGALGLTTGSVKFSTDVYSNPDVFAVSATGISSSNTLNISPSSAAFTYSGDEKTFTITNPRVYPVRIDSISNTNSYWGVTSNTCAGELAANSSCVVKVKYSSTRSGKYSSTLKVISQSIAVATSALNGSLEYGAPALSQTSINAPTLLVGQPYTTSVTLTNSGTGTLIVQSASFESDNNALSFTSNTCNGASLSTGQSCAVGVKILFASEGNVQTNLAFTLANSATNYAAVGLFASAQALSPVLTVTPSSLDFGAVLPGVKATVKQVTLASTGNAPVTVSDLKLSGANSGQFAIENKASCIGVLSNGNQCVINVSYTGATTVGGHSATLTATSNSASATNSVALSGQTVKPVLTISPSSASITGDAGQTFTRDFVVTNTSTTAATLSKITSTSAAYSLTGSTCTVGQSLAAQDTCVIRAVLANAAVGTGGTNLSVEYTGSGVLSASVTHTINAVKQIPNVSDITCPTISAAWTPTSSASIDYCSLTIENTSTTTPLYVPNTGLVRAADSDASFAVVAGTSLLKTGVTGFIIPASGTAKVYFKYTVPATAGSLVGKYTLTTYSNINDASTATSFTKSGTVSVVDPLITLDAISCPASVYQDMEIFCTATLSNRSLSAYSNLVAGSNYLTNAFQLATKFSEVTVDGAPLSSKTTARPSSDAYPSTAYSWTVNTSSLKCSTGASSTTLPSGTNCSLTIAFKPSIVGVHSAPLYLPYKAGTVSKWLKSSVNASFEVKSANVDLVATPFVCTPAYVGNTGICTTTLTNTTIAGAKYFSVPTASVSGAAANIVTKVNGYATASHTCTVSPGIAPGKSCTYSLSFKGTTPGDFPSTVTLTSSGQTDTVAMAPKVLAPDITFAPFVCPTAANGDTVTCTSSITNNMGVSVSVSSLGVVGSGYSAPVMNIRSIAPNGSQPVTMAFRSLTAGTFSATVTANMLTYGPLTAQAVVTVKDVPAATGSLTPFTCPALNYGSTGNCTATLSNTSSQRSLAVGSISKTFNSAFGNISHTCASSLAPSANCVITVPVNAVNPGTYSTTVTVNTTPVLTQNAAITINNLLFSVVPAQDVKTATNLTVTQTTTFKNENSFNVAIPASGSITLSGTGYSYAVNGNNCSGKTLASKQTCTVVTSFIRSTAGVWPGAVKLTVAGASVEGPLSVTTTVPRLVIAPAYSVVTTDVGLRSLSGNWYKVTNDSPTSATLSKFSTTSQILVLADSSVSGGCFPGKVLAANESCLILEQNNVAATTAGNPVVSSNSGTVTTTSGMTGSWTSKYNTFRGTLAFDQTSYTGMPNKTLSGSIVYTNIASSAVSGLSFAKNSKSTATGTLTFTGNGCSGTIPAGGSCTQGFTYTGASVGSGSIYVDATGKFQRLLNGQAQGWGESTIVASNATAGAVYLVAPTGVVTPGAYNPTVANWSTSDATSTFTNTAKFSYTVTNVTFANGTDQSLISTNCIGRTLGVGESCSIVTRFSPWKNRAENEWVPGTITVTVENSATFTGLVRVFRCPWCGPGDTGGPTTGTAQSKVCMFKTSTPIESDFTGCYLDMSYYGESRTACATTASWATWLNYKLFTGFQTKTSAMGTSYLESPTNYSSLTWKNSGMPVKPVTWKNSRGTTYGFGVRPFVQIYMNGQWTDYWNTFGINASSLMKSHSSKYNNSIPNGQTAAVPSDMGGFVEAYWSFGGSPYSTFITLGTTTSGYSARTVWEENTPGTECHMPGTIRVR